MTKKMWVIYDRRGNILGGVNADDFDNEEDALQHWVEDNLNAKLDDWKEEED